VDTVLRLVVYSWPNATKMEVRQVAERRFLIKANEVIEGAASFSHSWNPNSAIRGTRLSRLVRLSRTGVNLVRIPPGKEFFVYQSHHRGE
jgi:hypothetical protein